MIIGKIENLIQKWGVGGVALLLLIQSCRLPGQFENLSKDFSELNTKVDGLSTKVDELIKDVAHIEGFLAAKSGEQFSSTSDDDYEKGQDKGICNEDEDNPVVFVLAE